MTTRSLIQVIFQGRCSFNIGWGAVFVPFPKLVMAENTWKLLSHLTVIVCVFFIGGRKFCRFLHVDNE